jgi:hypothetical protein
MTIIRGARRGSSTAPTFTFKNIGDGVAGRIAELSEYQSVCRPGPAPDVLAQQG